MQLDPSLLILVLPVVATISLHVLKNYFEESVTFRPLLELRRENRTRSLAEKLQEEMENRIFANPQPINAEGDIANQRRIRFSRQQTDLVWMEARTYHRIEQIHTTLCGWEDRGKQTCFIGTILNMLLALGGIVVILMATSTISVSGLTLGIILFLLVAPVLITLFCYFFVGINKRRLQEALDN
jgi:hypothetical protein